MKKLTFLVIATATLGMIACSGGKQNGYIITGTVEGANDGDSVFLQERVNHKFVQLDTAVITNGTFTFKGAQDSTVSRYIFCKTQAAPLQMDFFLENGKINITLTKDNDSATGTPSNDAYQELRTPMSEMRTRAIAIYKEMSDTTLTDEQRVAKQQESMKLQEEYRALIRESVKKNIGNPVGVYFFKQTYYDNSTAENEELLSLISEQYQNDEVIVGIKKQIEKEKKTAIGNKFTDFEMQTPEGKTVKLSDYVGKGKVVLIDFWASWCGPCRREMPNLVETYAKYKDKNFEIVGVSLDQDATAWKDAIKKLNMTWPQMSDLKYWQSEGAQLYAVTGIPHTVLIDGEGTIIARGLHGEDLQNKVAEALK